MIELQGLIKKIIYYNEKNNYIVINTFVKELEQNISMVGYMVNPKEGSNYLFNGVYTNHYRYGKQFSFNKYQLIETNDELIKYLASPAFKGIGTVLAKRIVEAFGVDTIKMIILDYHCLLDIKGMTEQKAKSMQETIIETNKDQELVDFFVEHNLSLKLLGQVQAKHKDKSLEIIKTNPYQLLDSIEGLSFKIIDDLALKVGFDPLSPLRLEALIIYLINDLSFRMGATYLIYNQISQIFYRLIKNISVDDFDLSLETLVNKGKLIRDGDRYYLTNLYQSEVLISQKLKYINNLPKDEIDVEIIDKLIEESENSLGIKYASNQKKAFKSFLENNVVILTGGPGTGKTTIVKNIINLSKKLYPREPIALVAPTGRAAKRLTDLSGIKASTIHSLLKWDLESNTFKINKDNPLEEEILIVDEVSMVDSFLLSQLLQAGPFFHKILLIGDYHQLPSVRQGNILYDLMQTDLTIVELKEVFRQGNQSGILDLATDINQDTLKDLNDYQTDDLIIKACNKEQIMNYIKRIIQELLDFGYTINDLQVMAPIYRGGLGIDQINEELQELYNPYYQDCLQLKFGKQTFRINDKVLQLKNRPDDDIYNGDIGNIVDIIVKDGFDYLEDTVVVDFEGTFVEYLVSDLNQLTLAYCMSIHKSQGSEFKAVIMPIVSDYSIMLQRKLLYTGITRAKEKLFLIGNLDAFIYGLSNDEQIRQTSLSQIFSKELDEDIYLF